MSIKLPNLPYELNALEPYISKETLEYHYGKHHQAYVNNLNNLIANTEYANQTLNAIIKLSKDSIFNNAAQVWNHNFYWQCLQPVADTDNQTKEPAGELAAAINQAFGNFNNFKEQFTKMAIATFGSGWAWLIKNNKGELQITSTSNANTPMTNNQIALLTCDVWEHAYYIDYRNARPQYVDAFWKLVNWNFVTKNFHE